MLFIHNDVVEKVMTMADCIDSLETAFRQIPSGGAIHRPRIDMYVPCEREDGYYRWGTMEGANDGIFAIRMKSDVMTWPRDASGNWRENKYCVKPGTFCGVEKRLAAYALATFAPDRPARAMALRVSTMSLAFSPRAL